MGEDHKRQEPRLTWGMQLCIFLHSPGIEHMVRSIFHVLYFSLLVFHAHAAMTSCSQIPIQEKVISGLF